MHKATLETMWGKRQLEIFLSCPFAVDFWMKVSLPGMGQNLKVALICISLMDKVVTCFLEYLLFPLVFLLLKPLHPTPHNFVSPCVDWQAFGVSNFCSCLHILDMSLLSEVAGKDFLYPVGCLLALLVISFAVQKLPFHTVPFVNSWDLIPWT